MNISSIPNPDNKVCRLAKSFYGMKQASRQWFSRLLIELQKQGFQQSKNDYSLFIKHQRSDITIAIVYVHDDILLTGIDRTDIDTFKSYLHMIFNIKDLGLVHYFLGMKISIVPSGIIMTQKKFTQSLLQNSGFDLPMSATTPFIPNFI